MLQIAPCIDELSQRYDRIIDDLCDISETYFYQGKLDDALHVLQAGEALLVNDSVSDSGKAKLFLQRIQLYMQDNFLARHTND